MLNVLALCQEFGMEFVGFLTLTFGDHVLDPAEARRRFRSLVTHVLDKRHVRWIRIFERQKSGRIHFHLLVVLPKDIRTGVNFEAFEKNDYRSAGLFLRSEWAFWRKTAKQYGFGRTELMPVKSCAGALGSYVGKYISKHIESREERDKGVRLVGYKHGTAKASSRFTWVSPRSWLWRSKLAVLAREMGFKDISEFAEAFGPKWAWCLAAAIMAVDLKAQPGGVTYPTVNHYIADGHSIPDFQIDFAEPVHCQTVNPKVRKRFRSQDEEPIWAVKEWPELGTIEKPSPEDIEAARRNADIMREFAAGLSKCREERRYKDE